MNLVKISFISLGQPKLVGVKLYLSTSRRSSSLGHLLCIIFVSLNPVD